MLYTEKVLQPGETIRFSTKLHWIVYLRGIVIVVLGVIVAVALRQLNPDAPDAANGFSVPSLVAIAVGLVFGIFSLINAWCQRYITEATVTDRRIVVMRGFISRSSMEMNMDKVETVFVHQSILARALNYGNIVVVGTGGTPERLPPHIARPMDFREFIIAR